MDTIDRPRLHALLEDYLREALDEDEDEHQRLATPSRDADTAREEAHTASLVRSDYQDALVENDLNAVRGHVQDLFESRRLPVPSVDTVEYREAPREMLKTQIETGFLEFVDAQHAARHDRPFPSCH